jgi:hypothetical protein
MKKILIAIIALLCVFKISNAQTEKGTQNLGLNLSFAHLKIDNNNNPSFNQSQKTTSFNIGPDYSFFVAKDIDLGFLLNYNTSSQENTNTTASKQDDHGYSAGVYMRKYFLYDGKIGLRTGGHFTYGHSNTKVSYSFPNNFYNYDTKTNAYSGNLSLELVAYPTKKLGIAAALAGINYVHSKQNGVATGNTTYNNISAGFANDGLTMSVFYVIGKK